MAWFVYLLDKEYPRGITLSRQEMLPYEKRLDRTERIEKGSLNIKPQKLN